jgi:hypothetical protein
MDLWGGDNTDQSYHACLSPELRIGWNLFVFLSKTKLSDIVEALELEGEYDYAVPQQWAEANKFPVAIWWYPPSGQEGHIFGKPILLKEMLEMLRTQYVNQG